MISSLIAIIIAFIAGFFLSKRAARQDAEVIDIKAKIKEKQDEAKTKQDIADQKVKEYEEALKKFNSDNNDGGDNTPA